MVRTVFGVKHIAQVENLARFELLRSETKALTLATFFSGRRQDARATS
jgi:hypothetical protein